MNHIYLRCDIAAFLFDSSCPESFRKARSMMEVVSSAAGETLPCVLVASKDDLGMAQVSSTHIPVHTLNTPGALFRILSPLPQPYYFGASV